MSPEKKKMKFFCQQKQTTKKTEQEDRAVEGNHRAMQGTCTESLT